MSAHACRCAPCSLAPPPPCTQPTDHQTDQTFPHFYDRPARLPLLRSRARRTTDGGGAAAARRGPVEISVICGRAGKIETGT